MTIDADILVVDDDPTVRDVITRYLDHAGYRVRSCADGSSALAAIGEAEPRLVVLDLMLPDIDGIQVCGRIKERGDLPVIMLTALGEEEDRVLGLEVGADDYVTKPFSPRELVLRIASVLRRAERAASPTVDAARPITDGDLVVDPDSRVARLAGVELPLTVREFDLLAYLVSNPGRVFTRVELLEDVWGWTFGDQSTVTVHIRRLREKVESDPTRPRRVTTVWGVGYRYDPKFA